MSQVKERPILFSAPMVRAILEGRKTVTRRAVRAGFNPDDLEGTLSASECRKLYRELPQHFGASYFCPYGQPGDRLWVRETWAGPLVDEDQMHLVEMNGWDSFRKPEHCQYRASGGTAEFFDYAKDETVCRWTPSIHMPRWASRILLEITDVRVERLQDISEDQAQAEGVRLMRDGSDTWVSREGPGNLVTPWPTAKEAFSDLWNSIDGPHAWAANPWVWAVSFKRVKP